MRVVITGASGFVGNGLARHLCANPNALGRPISKLILADLPKSPDEREPGENRLVEWRCGNLADPAWLDALLDKPVDLIFHLASLPGALAEQRPDLGWSANLTAPMKLAERLARQGREQGRVARVVFSSTIAVYGPLGPGPVTEDHPARPANSYGSHKLMTEILFADLSRRGEIDARSVRLPGIVARPIGESGHGSAFMSLLFHKAKTGEPYVCPVSASAAAWWMSLRCCLANLVHAANLPAKSLSGSRTVQLPVLYTNVRQIVAALNDRFGVQATLGFRYEPDAAIEGLFGRFPPIATPFAESLGFRKNLNAQELVAEVFS